MKKILVISAITTLGALSSMAQGTIVFGNSSAQRINAVVAPLTTNVIGTASTAYGLGPAQVRFSLLMGANGSALSSMIPVVANNSGGATVVSNSPGVVATAQGTFSGGSPLIPTGQAWSDGSSLISFAYIAWSFSSGATSYTQFIVDGVYTQKPAGFSTGYSGWSGIISGYDPGQGSTLPPATFGTNTWQTRAFTLERIPEPATFVLAGLGLAGMLIRRRA
jgi:hypothetical protein